MLRTLATTFAVSAFLSTSALAAIVTKDVDHTTKDGMVMQSFVAYDDAKEGARPGILIVHDWMGLGKFTKAKAKELAAEGYVAMAVDMYGKGVRPANEEEASIFATKYKNDRALMRSHILSAYDQLASMKQTDKDELLVMGYCFGGTTALELARSGADLEGTVSFHGGLSTPTPEDAKNIKGDVLVLHGADDPLVPPSEVDAFKKEMDDAGVDLTFVSYPGAVHAFAVPGAGNDPKKGAAYNEEADKASWKEFRSFLDEVF